MIYYGGSLTYDEAVVGPEIAAHLLCKSVDILQYKCGILDICYTGLPINNMGLAINLFVISSHVSESSSYARVKQMPIFSAVSNGNPEPIYFRQAN